METERQPADTILELINLAGVVSAIQDDPDSPDGDWLTAISNNVDSVCRVSFPTPTGNPTVGTDLQEFRVLVRKMGGTGTPAARIELYENGVLIRAGSDIDITTDTVLSFSWNASELGTPDGSLVECRLYGKKSGGSPTARAAIEVGAVEWNVEYDIAGEEHSGSGSVSGNGSVSGVAKKGGKGSALKSAGGTLLAIGLAGMLGIASIAGGGSQLSAGEKSVGGSGSISGNGSVIATGQAGEEEEHSGTTIISGNGVIAGVAIKHAHNELTITGSGTLAGAGVKRTQSDSVVTGGGLITATGQADESEAGEYSGVVAISGNGMLVASGMKSAEGIGVVSGGGNIVLDKEEDVIPPIKPKVKTHEISNELRYLEGYKEKKKVTRAQLADDMTQFGWQWTENHLDALLSGKMEISSDKQEFIRRYLLTKYYNETLA